NTDTGNAVTDMLFDPPVVRGILAYSVQNGNVVAGAPEPTASFAQAKPAVITATNAADQLSLFWYNGAEWVKTTGQVDTADNTVSFTDPCGEPWVGGDLDAGLSKDHHAER